MNGTESLYAAAAVLLAGGGAALLYSSYSSSYAAAGPRRIGGDRGARKPRGVRGTAGLWLAQAGIGEVSAREFASAVVALFICGLVVGYLMFATPVPAVLVGLLTASFPISAYRRRRQSKMEAAAEAWPRLLEEMRLRTGSLGQSVPQALFEAAARAPDEWRAAFAGGEREWLLTTDFARTVTLLKDRLADATADAVLETLLLAHEIGGTDIDSRLAELSEDRIVDLQNRKDAISRQAGVRFARRFVLLVPLGMALAGLTIGTGRQAYATVGGQVAVAVGLMAVAGCWAWSGRLLRLPAPPRVFR